MSFLQQHLFRELTDQMFADVARSDFAAVVVAATAIVAVSIVTAVVVAVDAVVVITILHTASSAAVNDAGMAAGLRLTHQTMTATSAALLGNVTVAGSVAAVVVAVVTVVIIFCTAVMLADAT